MTAVTDPEVTETQTTDGEAQETPETAPTVDADTLLAQATDIDPASHQLLSMANELRKNLDSLKAELKTLSSKTDNFESLLENSDDETLIQYREALAKIRTRLNAVMQEAAQRMQDLGLETAVNLEDERTSLKEKIRAARKTLNLQLSVFDSYAKTVEGVDKWAPIADAIRPPKTVTAGKSGEVVAVTTEAGKVREWANSVGLKVNERGRIPSDVYAAYAKAHPSVAAVADDDSDEDDD